MLGGNWGEICGREGGIDGAWLMENADNFVFGK